MPIQASTAAWPSPFARDRILQATPNALTKSTVATLARLSTGLGRKPLRTTIVAAMDIKTNRRIYRIATTIGVVCNRLLRANIRWQALAEPFLNYCDGVHTPLFEEFATGVAAISSTCDKRKRMFADADFRQAFRRDWEDTRSRVFHRNLDDMWVVSSPIAGQEGKSFDELARAAGRDPLDFFMDLLAEYDSAIRWKTVVTNDRDEERQYIMAHDTTLPGFNDSGAHARNMAFQDGGLQMLQQVLSNPRLMPIEKAIHKLTGQSAEWLGLDAGFLPLRRPGRRGRDRPAEAAHGPRPADRAIRRSLARSDANGEALRRRRATSARGRPRGIRGWQVRAGVRPGTLWPIAALAAMSAPKPLLPGFTTAARRHGDEMQSAK